MITLTRNEFDELAKLALDQAGLSMAPTKIALASARLRRRLKVTGHADVRSYLRLVKSDPTEMAALIDELTTNETRFFREEQHFEFLERSVLPHAAPPYRLWCGAASSGEEPYSLAMMLAEHLPSVTRKDARILATDIAASVLTVAKAGRYTADRIETVPADLRRRHFEPVRGDEGWYVVKPSTRAIVSFARLNLVTRWPMKGPFHAIFLRNVMIYFDAPTRAWLGRRMAQLLAPGGYLFIGHAETLGDSPAGLKRIRPAVYQRTREPISVGRRYTSEVA